MSNTPGHIYKTDDEDELTLLTFRSNHDTNAWIKMWVKEGDLNDKKELVCFKTDGKQIIINSDCEVFIYESQTIKWKNPKFINAQSGYYKQKTIHIRKYVGVDARFAPINRREIRGNV